MRLTTTQQARFWREWSAASQAQGWTRKDGLSEAEIDAKRHELLARAGFSSLKDVDRSSGFDRVLAELGILRSNLRSAQEADDPTIGEARRLRHQIQKVLLPCLAVYVADPAAYLTSLLSGMFRGRTIDDLTARPLHSRVGSSMYALRESPSELEQLRMTLTARVDTMRAAAGHSRHEMLTRAGLPCHCRLCSRAAKSPPMAPSEPPVAPEAPAAHADTPETVHPF